jgi:glutaryl-CoA dehydrogenase
MLADDSYTEETLRQTRIGQSMGTDYFALRDELTDAERDYLQRTRQFVDTEVLPVINDYWERAEFPRKLIEKLGGLGIIGDGLTGYGCAPMSPVAAGLINMELNRGDGSLGTFHAVQAGLAMRAIHMLGSEEQKQYLLSRRCWSCGGGRPSSATD